jgi:hypothetical protein
VNPAGRAHRAAVVADQAGMTTALRARVLPGTPRGALAAIAVLARVLHCGGPAADLVRRLEVGEHLLRT